MGDQRHITLNMNMLLAQPIYQLPHHLQRQAQAYQASAVGHASRYTRYSHQQHFRSLTVRGADPPDFDKGMWRLETKLLKQQLLTGKTEEQPARPWSMLVPSLDDLRRSDWPKLVKDWPIFWSLVNKWLEYECDTRPRTSVQDLPFDEMKSQYHSQEELEGQLDNNFTLGRMHGNMVVERLEDYHNWYQIRDRQQVRTLSCAAAASASAVSMHSSSCMLPDTGMHHGGRHQQPPHPQPLLPGVHWIWRHAVAT